MPNHTETLMQMKSNSCMYPIHSFKPLQYCCLNSPNQACQGRVPSFLSGHTSAHTALHQASVITKWAQTSGGTPLLIMSIENVQNSVKREVICLSLSSMIPPVIMEQPYHNQTDQSQHRHADQRVTEADYQDDPLFCWGLSWWKQSKREDKKA